MSVRARSWGLQAFSGHHRRSTIPQAPKLSVCARFRKLWAFSGLAPLSPPLTTPRTLEIKCLRSISGVTTPPSPTPKNECLCSLWALYPPPPPRQPSDPITPEIECECSFSVVVVSLWLPTSTTPPKSSTNMVCFRVWWFPFPCCRFSFLSLLYSLSSFIP